MTTPCARRLAALLLLLPLAGCESIFHGFSIIPPQEPLRTPFTRNVLAELAIPRSGDPAAVPLLSGAPRSSVELVLVQDRIAPRYHQRSDVTIYLLEGEGDLLLDRQWRRIAAGTLIHVPMNVPHAYVNCAPCGSRLLSTFTPPHVDGDEVALKEEARE
ncbi:MAG: cupin domain-containing protein [Planctomycetes bacterium]|nr:cupin domain-containing protein [Planctomycetota bacterium]